jgi:hypothetical protein
MKTVATVDAIHAAVIREALEDAGIAFRLVEPPRKRLPELVPREQLVVEVAEEAEAAARALLAQLAADGEAAALEQYDVHATTTSTEPETDSHSEVPNAPRS